jgi:hypothetical protein
MKTRQEAENVDLHCKELKADSANVAFILEHLEEGEQYVLKICWRH